MSASANTEKTKLQEPWAALRKFFFSQGAIVGYIGIILIIGSILINVLFFDNSPTHFQEITIQILSHFGIGLLAISILSILMENEHWKEYYGDRLYDIISGENYLKKLKPDQRNETLKRHFKIFYNINDIEESGSFYNYYNTNIQPIILNPYRENAESNIQIQNIKDNPDSGFLACSETIAYNCRTNNKEIQKNICYNLEEDCLDAEFEVSIHHKNLINKEIKKLGLKGDEHGKIIFKNEYLQNYPYTDINQANIAESNDNATKKTINNNNTDPYNVTDKKQNKGFKLPTEHFGLDNLQVVITVKFKFNSNKFIALRMSELTKNLSIYISYPEDFKLHKEYFFNKHDKFLDVKKDSPNPFYLTINDWLMPKEGVAFQLLPNNQNKDQNG